MKKLSIYILAFLGMFASAEAQQWGSYTLYSVQNSTAAYLIDTNNNVYHSWTFATNAKTGYSTYLLEGGTILRTVSRTGNSFTGGPICGQVQKVDWSGNMVWDYVYSTTNYCTHHDICPMPNGNVLLIAYERKTATETSAAGSSSSIEMWPDKIVEVQPTGATTGNVVWEWHAWDHLVQNADPNKANYQASISAHPELLNINYNTQKDWMHVNGVDYNAQLDQIVISSHNLSEIYVIDHSTTTAEAASHAGGNSGKGGDILYRWGNPAVYSAGTSANQVLKVVHDAHWVPQGCPKAGYLVGFNNNGISNSQSCVDMVNPPLSGNTYTITAGSAFTPASYSYRHSANGHTNNMGGSQQLPNGNMLVCIAQSGYIYEIDSNNNVLWSKTVSGGAVPKAKRYSACYVTGNPATPTITLAGSTLTSSSASGNQWFLNGSPITGATSQNYTATTSGAYTVQVTDTSGCISSVSTATTVTITGINDLTQNIEGVVYPNPTTGILHIKSETGTQDTVSVFDTQGKLLKQVRNEKDIDLSMFGNGIYYLSIKNGQNIINQKVTLIR